MLFNSLSYLVFFVFVYIVYWQIHHQYWRLAFLLLVSFYFYASWKPAYLLLIILTIITSYTAALAFSKYPQRKKLILVFTLILNLGILGIFKYLGFFSYTLNQILSWLNLNLKLPEFNLLLPVGISFYTLQSVGYLIDVYKKKIPAEKNLFHFTLFVTFFPQLVAGPIERSHHLLPQLKKKHHYSYSESVAGLKLIALGLFKKMVVADNLALLVNVVYDRIDLSSPASLAGSPKGLSLIIATYAFAWQIYGDFSGYSDIARGSAKMLGIKLRENFHAPYFAKSVTDFWRRWHISLSNFFMDYVYIPLGGNRRGLARHCANLMIVFLLCGLWHGASWHFVLWGFYFGIVMIIERLLKTLSKKTALTWHCPSIVQIAYTNIAVTFGWIFFRANNLQQAFYVIRYFFTGIKNIIAVDYIQATLKQLFTANYLEMAITTFCFLAILIYENLAGNYQLDKWFSRQKPIWRYAFYILIIAMLIMLKPSQVEPFIYFQF